MFALSEPPAPIMARPSSRRIIKGNDSSASARLYENAQLVAHGCAGNFEKFASEG